MKYFYISIVISTFTLIFSPSLAQDIEIPKEYKFERESDYKPYQDKVMESIRWMQQNSPVDNEKWSEAENFVSQWLTGTPTVTVSLLTDYLATISGDKNEYSAQMANLYLFSKALFYMENPDNKDIVAPILFSLEKVMELYNKMKSENDKLKHKSIEKFISLKEKGKLKETVEKEVYK